jgi:hypothetical protein
MRSQRAEILPRENGVGSKLSSSMGLEGSDERLTREIHEREMRIWNAYQRGDVAAHNALLARNYRAVHPDGSVHGKPTAQQIASEPMSAFRFSNFLAEPLGEDFALVTYVADVEGPGPGGKELHLRFVVGELWVREDGQWRVRSYQPTVVG